jgi:tetratricopeptide (TPR) repeat protein
VKACVSGLDGSAGQDPKAYIQLAVAHSSAGDPRCALRSLAIAQHLAVSGSRWELLIKIETAQSLLAIGHVDDADASLRGVMPMILEMPRTFGNGILFASCCTLLCKTSMQQTKLGAARAWLRRALNIQADLGLNASLATSLELDAKILSRQGKYALAKRTLQTAEDIMSEAESDECLKASLQVQIADVETKLGEDGPARARLSRVLTMLRKRKHDHFATELLPIAACALARIVIPWRRIRRKTWIERVEHREAASQPGV